MIKGLEGLKYKKKLRELGLLYHKKRSLKGILPRCSNNSWVDKRIQS